MEGVTAEEIEKYSYEDLKKFLEKAGFKSRTLGKDIFKVFKKEGVTGKGLLNRSYNDLISLKVPKEDARKLRLVLSPLMVKADVAKLDNEDTCIWASSVGATRETETLIREHNITGKKLIESKDLNDFLTLSDIGKDDISKIVDAVTLLNYEKYNKMGMSAPIVKRSALTSLPNNFPSTYYRTLEEALDDAKFVCIKDMLDDAKRKWEASPDSVKRGVLTEEEAASIFIYSYDFGKAKMEKNPFRIVNKVLAERNTHALPRLCGYIMHLLTALRKLQRYDCTGKAVYRGVEGPVSPNVKQVGNVMTWPAFTSTTKDETAVGNFIMTAREPIVFEVRGAFCGYDISPFSALGESEVLLEPETMFRVVEVKSDSTFPGATRIVVEAVENQLMLEEMVTNFNREKDKRAPVKQQQQQQQQYGNEDAGMRLPPNWEERVEPNSGRKYYANLLTKVTQWEFPTN